MSTHSLTIKSKEICVTMIHTSLHCLTIHFYTKTCSLLKAIEHTGICYMNCSCHKLAKAMEFLTIHNYPVRKNTMHMECLRHDIDATVP